MMEKEDEEGSGEYDETIHKYIYLGLRDFCAVSIIQYSIQNTTFQKLDVSTLSWADGQARIHSLLDPLEKDNFSHLGFNNW